MNSTGNAIVDEALKELAEEDHRAKVEAAKARIRERRSRPWWRKLFPFRVRIERL